MRKLHQRKLSQPHSTKKAKKRQEREHHFTSASKNKSIRGSVPTITTGAIYKLGSVRYLQQGPRPLRGRGYHEGKLNGVPPFVCGLLACSARANGRPVSGSTPAGGGGVATNDAARCDCAGAVPESEPYEDDDQLAPLYRLLAPAVEPTRPASWR